MAVSFCGKRLILTRSSLLRTPKRNGYIVLVPEFGEDLPEKNPLLKEDGFPQFNRITIEKWVAWVGTQAVEYEQRIRLIDEAVGKSENTDVFEDVVIPLEEATAPLDTTWGLAKALYLGNQSLMPPKCYSNIHNRSKAAKSSRYGGLAIYKAFKNAMEDKKLNLTEEQRRLIRKYVLEGKLNGAEIAPTDKMPAFVEGNHQISNRQGEFSQKLEIATRQFNQKIRDPNVMKDFPEEYLKVIAVDPSQPQKGPWTVTLQPYIKETFYEYCPDSVLKQTVWKADVRRCAHFNDRFLETSTTLEHIRDYRKSKAEFLGYKSFAHMSMETKMAGSIENVYNFFDTILEIAKPAQIEELNDLKGFAIDRGFFGDLNIWDVPYWGRKQKRTLYSLKEEELKEYFTLPQVLSSLFRLSERIFDVKFVERKTVDVWNQDVRLFDILESNSSEPVASFYLDPYERPNEKPGIQENSGWMVAMRNKSVITHSNPLAALIFNFQPPKQGKPCLLSFKDLQVLFSKFGHALQHLLTRANYSDVAGLSNVEWDAVEISSNFMLNWLYEPSTLKDIGAHYETGEALPKEVIDGLTKIRSHLAGFSLCKEIYLGRLDMELHSTEKFWRDIIRDLWPQHIGFPIYDYDAHPCTFGEIFSGDWGAAYYSHLWARMVAADVYGAFQELPPGNEEQQSVVGKRYRETFLSSGGGCHPSELFRKFRGRDPNPKALLKNLELKTLAKTE
ncbi:probable cytosolic oligopeptidase A [Athalia rosae]|uniref:probable cytosolic oligopeptidase A n=1 Tax=Athalia rosae TaxID=37344 RepID=UPI002033E0E1|nr:probable cytosolic oligopeptidase A [Athalia rosae]